METRLLAILLVDAGKVVSSSRMIDGMWGDSAPINPEAALQTQISRLRTALGSSNLIVNRSPGYLLRIEPDQFDVAVFERHIAEARNAQQNGSISVAVQRLSSGEAMWSGPAFSNFAFEDFAFAEASRLELLRLTASVLRLDCQLELGMHDESIPELATLGGQHPLDERLAQLYAVALYRGGRQADALRVIDSTTRALRDEIGSEPSPATEAVYEAILRHSPNLEATPRASDPPRGPTGSLLPSSPLEKARIPT